MLPYCRILCLLVTALERHFIEPQFQSIYEMTLQMENSGDTTTANPIGMAVISLNFTGSSSKLQA